MLLISLGFKTSLSEVLIPSDIFFFCLNIISGKNCFSFDVLWIFTLSEKTFVLFMK